ncbi:TPA: hypothetical protein IAC10_12720 [Candidatus Scatousia excrementigallinarum]|uniref:LPS-assembly protein LptD n=1 Tax=Candidatus Scatousia excrementigallinarum TaxID=2840935 RepID=A0A9D1JNW9_9BACT|nr:hypothetical protein [Candidatus Scatousia excrementigallinarum]
MKKYVVLSLITLMLGLPSLAATPEENKQIMSDMEKLQDALFMAPVVPLPEVNYDIKTIDDTRGMEKYTATKNGMPLFKKMRIKIQNYYKIKAHEDDLEQQKREAEELKRLQAEEEALENGQDLTLDELTDRNLKKIYNKTDDSEINQEKQEKKLFSFFKKDKKQDNNSEVKKEKQTSETIDEKSDTKVELSGGVQQQVAPKDIQLDCDTVQYYDDKNEVEATGNPVLFFPPQGITLKADKIVYNTTSNIIKAYGNVEIIKDGNSIFGDFIQINMNEETTFLENMTADKMMMRIRAKNAQSVDNKIILEKGDMRAAKPYVARFKTRIIGTDLSTMVISDEDRSYLDQTGTSKVALDAKEIDIDADKEHNVVTIKDADLSYNDRHLLHFKSMKLFTDKNSDYFEANYPELGSRSNLGMFAGPGFVFKTPFASTVKLIPFINYKNEIGLGGAIKYKSSTNQTELFYGSAEDVFVMRGKQQLDDNLYLQYGSNSYLDDWFMGNRMAKYAAELVYNNGKRVTNFLGPKRDLSFKNRLSAGIMEDNDRAQYDSKNMTSTGMTTPRFKYMSELTQNLYSYENKEELKILRLDLSMQGSAALYGNGDTQIVGRIGPRIHTQYKYWMQDIGYYASAYQDNSPMPMFDAYRYGHSNLYLREALRINKYLTIAYATSINLSDDAPNKKQWQENAFIFALGPDDFKINLGYDFVRQNTYFGVNIALDTKNTSVNFDKMVIKNPDRLASNEKEVKEVSFEEQKPVEKVKRTYAEVIELEDPNREEL